MALSTELLSDFLAVLRPRVAGSLRTGTMDRALYSTDASMYQIPPLGVLIPRHVDDVQAALEAAWQFGIPVLPRGAGSSLAGQAVGAALIIDFSRSLDATLEVNTEERWVRVQPGLVLDHLNDILQPYGFMIGPDPASSNRATLGGMVGNNSTGTHSILYGNTIEHVRAARALLDDGTAVDLTACTADAWAARMRRVGREGQLYRDLDTLLREHHDVIERDTPAHWRRTSGYRLEYLLNEAHRNVAQVLCGSEGTLGVLTEITLGLVPRPQQTALGVVHFHTRREALQAVTALLETEPSAVELFDGTSIRQSRQSPGFAHRVSFIEGDPGAVLFVEYYGSGDAELTGHLDRLADRCQREGLGYAILRATRPEQIADVWAVRKEALGLLMSIEGDHKPVAFIEDAAVPVAHLADYIDDLSALLEETDTDAVMYAHASGGCLHVRPFINTKDAAEVLKMRELSMGAMGLARRYGGVISSEHGDGLARSWLNEGLLGPKLYEANRQLKQAFDPQQLLNPGKVVDAPPMTENLRMGPGYTTLPVLTDQDFSDQGGLTTLVEMCNGNGACRKLHTGTMCPSFMVTREERHSTRGRANALRMALSGDLPAGTLTSPEMYDVMDLCIQCKACKTECPSNVDMAKLKTAWLSHYWEEHTMPMREELFAHLPRLSRALAGSWARPINWVSGLRPMRWLMDQILEITSYRKLPPFATDPLPAWFLQYQQQQALQPTGDGAPRPQVVLYADTFNTFHHPGVAQAATTFLTRAGYDVRLSDARVCCGRTYLSKGLVVKAQLEALQTVDALYPLVTQGLPIVGLEPSCILTISDEYPTLLPGDPRVRRVASAATTFDQFVAAEAERGALDHLHWTAEARQVLLHGHCHQKALVGTAATEAILSLPPGYQVELIDSGCCGMAGSFGYEKEHLSLSMAMAERRLVPAVRAAPAATIIAAPGTSCRAQIGDLTDRHAQHPAEILNAALLDEPAP